MRNEKKAVMFFSLILSLRFAGGVTEAVTVTVDAQVQHQEFEGWGTSICWWGNIIGNYPGQTRDSVMDLLFDTTDGLGLSILRYNIGGGDNPSHNHMGTGKMMEGFKASETAQYDWTKDAGQRWCLDAAIKRIPSAWFIAEAFSNSPPYWMTNSGCASGNSGGSNNLKSGYFDDFADYLTEVVKHFRDNWGITFQTLEPMNEPMIGWTVNGGQEGCHIDVSLQDDLIREVKSKLDAKGLTETKISAPDETSIDQTLSSWNSYDATTKSYVFQINTHVYSGSRRAELAAAAKAAGKKLWDSECDGSGAPAPFDQWAHNHNDIVPGLDIANRIIRDLRDMKVNGWIFWQAVESEQTQTSLNKNWGLIHADFNGGHKYYIPKKYHALRQFSGLIRPFSKMIDINNNDAVAFLSPKQDQLVIVQRNASNASVSYDYKLSNFKQVGPTASVWRSSATENFQKVNDLSVLNGSLAAASPAQSITTYTIKLDPTAAFIRGESAARPFMNIGCGYAALKVEFAAPGNRAFVKLYDLRGNLLRSIVLKNKSAGIYSSSLDLSIFPNGNYIVEVGHETRALHTERIMLTK
jgi:O-glycosyl hydrolase